MALIDIDVMYELLDIDNPIEKSVWLYIVPALFASSCRPLMIA